MKSSPSRSVRVARSGTALGMALAWGSLLAGCAPSSSGSDPAAVERVAQPAAIVCNGSFSSGATAACPVGRPLCIGGTCSSECSAPPGLALDAGSDAGSDSGVPAAPSLGCSDPDHAFCAIAACGTTIGGVGEEDFDIQFSFSTTATSLTALASQRADCTESSAYWEMRVQPDGRLITEVRASNGARATMRGYLPSNDGARHVVHFRRTAGIVLITLDGLVDYAQPFTAPFGALASLRMRTSLCGGVAALAGPLDGACLSFVPDAYTCRGCTGDFGSATTFACSSGLPYCAGATDGRCGACATQAHCTAPGTVCDRVTLTCIVRPADAGADTLVDGASDAPADAALVDADAASDAIFPVDAEIDAGPDALVDAGLDVPIDAPIDALQDATIDPLLDPATFPLEAGGGAGCAVASSASLPASGARLAPWVFAAAIVLLRRRRSPHRVEEKGRRPGASARPRRVR